MKRYLILAFSLLYSLVVMSQKELTLEDCIEIALENNLDLQSRKLNKETAHINHQQSRANLLPSINGNYNLGVNNGRSIDPFTNDFINQRLVFSNANLSLDATIFNGFRLLNSIKQQQLNLKAATLEVEQQKQDLVLAVTLAYMQVLNSQDILLINQQRLAATNRQLKVQKDVYEQGRDNPADYTDLLGQKSLDETNILNSQVALNNAKLELSRLMNLKSPFHIEAKEILFNNDSYSLTSEQVYADAIKSMASFKAQELRVKAAKKGIHVAKAQLTPELSLFGQLNTNYSSVAETFTEVGSSIEETGDFVRINNQEIPVLTQETSFSSNKIEYLDQFENNLNSVIGLSLRIPFFNGFRAKNNIALEKVRLEESIVALKRNQLEVKNAIKQVHFDMEAAYSRYKSFQKQVKAFEKSFDINQVRFNNGVSNFLAYITSKNNLENAKINLSNAKYSYLLRVQVLEYYRGKSM